MFEKKIRYYRATHRQHLEDSKTFRDSTHHFSLEMIYMKWKEQLRPKLCPCQGGGGYFSPPPSHHHPTAVDPFSLDVGTAMALYSRHGSPPTAVPMVHCAQSGTTRWAPQNNNWVDERSNPNLWLCLVMLIDLAIVLTEHCFRLVVKYNDSWKQQLGLQKISFWGLVWPCSRTIGYRPLLSSH